MFPLSALSIPIALSRRLQSFFEISGDKIFDVIEVIELM
jgi:hypothetical protein